MRKNFRKTASIQSRRPAKLFTALAPASRPPRPHQILREGRMTTEEYNTLLTAWPYHLFRLPLKFRLFNLQPTKPCKCQELLAWHSKGLMTQPRPLFLLVSHPTPCHPPTPGRYLVYGPPTPTRTLLHLCSSPS